MKSYLNLISISLLLLCSCSHYYYVADTQNVPMFREKNEYRISGAFGFGDESYCFEAQSAYAFSNNIGVMADLMHAWGGELSGKDFGRGTSLNAGLGYFKPVSTYGVFEIYGGLGGSSQHHEYTGLHYDSFTGSIYEEYDGSADLGFFKLFLQPSFGVTYRKLDFIVSSRISHLSFMISDNNIWGNDDDYNDLQAAEADGQLFIEPAATLRGGWDNIKVQGQAAYIWHVNGSDAEICENYHFSVGVIFIMPKKIQP